MKNCILIAGGGTGGHIYPGLAIARAIQKLDPSVHVEFVGSRGGMEERIVPREGFTLHTLNVGQLHQSVGIWIRLKTLLLLPLAFLQALRILLRCQPMAVLGVGGFASGPLIFVASQRLFLRCFGLRVRSYVWEPNAQPGMANKLLARVVDACLLVFDDANAQLQSREFIRVGIPVRDSIQALRNKNVARQATAEHVNANKLKIFITGGSLGARFINNTIVALIADAVDGSRPWLSEVEFVHQTGRLDFTKLQAEYAAIQARFKNKSGEWPIQVQEFVHDMDKKYAWADLVICRAGASTVAEICAAQKAALFIPLPTAADNHQQKNAEVLVRAGAAQMILQKDLNVDSLRAVIEEYLARPGRLQDLRQSLEAFSFEHADQKIAEILLDRH